MSHNHHDSAYNYLESLGGLIICPKKKCQGKLIPVLIRTRNGRIREELECCLCGRVVRDWKLLREATSRKDKRGSNETKRSL